MKRLDDRKIVKRVSKYTYEARNRAEAGAELTKGARRGMG